MPQRRAQRSAPSPAFPSDRPGKASAHCAHFIAFFQVLTLDQKVTFEFMGSNYLAFVSSLVAKDMDAGETAQRG